MPNQLQHDSPLESLVSALFLGLAVGIICLLLFMAGCAPRHAEVTHAKWDGSVWSCPHGTDTWVDQAQALQDTPDSPKDFVYCVPQTKSEIEGITPLDAPKQTDEPLPVPQRTEKLVIDPLHRA